MLDLLSIQIIHWLVNPILYLTFSRMLLGRLKLLTTHHAFVVSYLVFIYIGTYSVYMNNLADLRFVFLVWLIPYVYLISVGISILVSRHSLVKFKSAFDGSYDMRNDQGLLRLLPFLSSIAVLIPIIYIFDKGVENIALFFLVLNPGSAIESMVLRIDSLNSNYSPLLTALYSYGRSLYYPLFAAGLSVLLISRQIRAIHFLMLIIPSMLFCFLSAAKAPLAIIFISIFLAIYYYKQAKISKFWATSLLSAGFLIPSLIYPLMVGASGQDGAILAISKLWERISYVPAFASALYFDSFGSLYQYAGFSSNRLFASLAGVDFVSVPALVYDYYLKTSISGGLVNASFFASFYADWGFIGTLVCTAAIAVILHAIQIFFDSNLRSAIFIGAKSVVVIAVTQLMLADFYSTANGRGLLSIPLLLIVLRIYQNTRSRGSRGLVQVSKEME